MVVHPARNWLASSLVPRLFVLTLFLASQSASAITLSPRALQREVFANSDLGRRLSTYLIGSPVQTTDDLTRLLARINSSESQIVQIRNELELRMPQLARELEKLPASASLRDHLDSAVLRVLQFETSPQGVHFFPFFSELPSASFTRNGQNFLEALPVSRFEGALPRGPRSLDRSLSLSDSISTRLIKFEERYVHERGVLDGESIAHRLALTRPSLSVKEITDEILRIRESMVSDLRQWATEYQTKSPALSIQLRKTASELSLSADARTRYQQKAVELSGLTYEPRSYDDLIRGYNGKVQGELGELRVLVRVDDFSARGLKIAELGSLFPDSSQGRLAEAALMRHLEDLPQFAGKELDLILQNGKVWAEVKTFRDIFSQDHRQFRHVLEQLELTQSIREHLRTLPEWRQMYPEPIELQIYFVGGITEDAVRILEARGVAVFGARFQTPSPLQGRL